MMLPIVWHSFSAKKSKKITKKYKTLKKQKESRKDQKSNKNEEVATVYF